MVSVSLIGYQHSAVMEVSRPGLVSSHLVWSRLSIPDFMGLGLVSRRSRSRSWGSFLRHEKREKCPAVTHLVGSRFQYPQWQNDVFRVEKYSQWKKSVFCVDKYLTRTKLGLGLSLGRGGLGLEWSGLGLVFSFLCLVDFLSNPSG